MLLQHLGELANLIGFRQVDIAEKLGVSRAVMNRWLRGLQEIPEAKRMPLAAAVITAAEVFLAFYDEGLFPITIPRPDDEQNRQRVPAVKALVILCKAEVLGDQSYGLTEARDAALEALAVFRGMSEEAWRKPENAARFKQLAAYLNTCAEWVCCIGPMPERQEPAGGRKEDDCANNT